MGFIKVDKKAVDPALASLFASSSGPVEAPPKSRYQPRIQRPIEKESSADEEEEDDEVLSELSSQDDSDASEDDDEDSDEQEDADSDSEVSSEEEEDAEELARKAVLAKEDNSKKKRKRADKEEIEETYMRKLAREEEKEEEQRQKKRKTVEAVEEDESEDSSGEAEAEEDEDEEEEFTIPKHETQAETTDRDASEIEKATRTVFLSNVSNECIDSKSSKKALKKYLESFIADLADNKPPHKVESIRFRSTAFASALPKRAAFAKKEIMESTTHGTNAYAVYSTKVAAREAVKRLNGTIFLNRHLHVDSVAHPRENDHRRRVFVGNLPFVDDESQTPNPDGSEKKKKTPSDVEEGLWVHFSKVGKVESVRVVRDAQTRVGKGFAYVQFVDENGVEGALQLNEKKYPPMLPRKLRVTRCRAEKKNHKKEKPRGPAPSAKPNGKSGYAPKMSEEQKSQQGRARSMLGKVAKAQSKEAFVFEGHRASEKQGKAGLKFKGSGGSKKKGPNGRKSRSAAWKSKAK